MQASTSPQTSRSSVPTGRFRSANYLQAIKFWSKKRKRGFG